jgi:hypothetical protein
MAGKFYNNEKFENIKKAAKEMSERRQQIKS